MAEDMNPLEELLVDELKDLYSAENQIIKALPRMAKAATSPDLRRAFERHLEETRRQVERLDQIGEELEMKMTGKKCKGMEGLISEAEELIKEKPESAAVLDAGLIAAAQKVEHYEIAGYRSAVFHALVLGEEEIAELLNRTLHEEKEADRALSEVRRRQAPQPRRRGHRLAGHHVRPRLDGQRARLHAELLGLPAPLEPAQAAANGKADHAPPLRTAAGRQNGGQRDSPQFDVPSLRRRSEA